MFIVKDEKLRPVQKTKYSAGFDIRAAEDVTILPYNQVLIPTGVYLDTEDKKIKMLRDGAFFGLYIRSSLALKGLSLLNGVGVIDLDYPKEIKIIVRNNSDKVIEIKKYDRIGQLILQPHLGFEVEGVFREETLRTCGFGSTLKV